MKIIVSERKVLYRSYNGTQTCIACNWCTVFLDLTSTISLKYVIKGHIKFRGAIYNFLDIHIFVVYYYDILMHFSITLNVL